MCFWYECVFWCACGMIGCIGVPMAELPTQKKPTSVMDEPYFSNFTTISVITLKMQEHASATEFHKNPIWCKVDHISVISLLFQYTIQTFQNTVRK